MRFKSAFRMVAIVAAVGVVAAGGTLMALDRSATPAAQPAVPLIGSHSDQSAYTTNGYQNLGNPDFGVCRGTDPKCYHDWGNFAASKTKGYKVLVYTYTPGPRHANLGPALGPGLDPSLTDANVVQKSIIAMGKNNGFAVDWTEDPNVFSSPANLFKYNAVLFFTSRTALDDAGQTSLRIYIEGGGGFVGVHNAFGTQYNWDWYRGLLGGAQLYDHGPVQTATVQTLDRRDASTAGLPATWTSKDEWYNLVPAPSNVRILAAVDDKSMTQTQKGYYGDPGMGPDHPVTWCQYYDGGRAWLTTMGHDALDWTPGANYPGAANFQSMVLHGIKSAAGMESFCR